MAYFALFYDTIDNFVERRVPHRQLHLALVDEAYRDGRLLFAGALKPADGALLVFHTDSAADVERFAARDPYVINGLVRRWRVREWAVVNGDGSLRE